MKLPDLALTLEAQNLTAADLGRRLRASETEAREIIRGEANGEIPLGELRTAYAALGKEILILVVEPMTPEVQEEARERCFRDFHAYSDWSAPDPPVEVQLRRLRESFVMKRMRYKAPVIQGDAETASEGDQ